MLREQQTERETPSKVQTAVLLKETLRLPGFPLSRGSKGNSLLSTATGHTALQRHSTLLCIDSRLCSAKTALHRLNILLCIDATQSCAKIQHPSIQTRRHRILLCKNSEPALHVLTTLLCRYSVLCCPIKSQHSALHNLSSLLCIDTEQGQSSEHQAFRMKSKRFCDSKVGSNQVQQRRMWSPALLLCVVACCSVISTATACNKALCASDVSKCLLQELCQCQMKDGSCPCCQDCALCLGNVWEQCCDCVGLCSEDKKARRQSARRSSLEDLPEPVPSLFRALSGVQEGDPSLGWRAHLLTVSEEFTQKSHMDHILLGDHKVVSSSPSVNVSGVCTVLYFNPCMSMRRCHQSCESFGSSKYRWFHNGCCQCVGPDCYGYGNKEPLCNQCHL